MESNIRLSYFLTLSAGQDNQGILTNTYVVGAIMPLHSNVQILIPRICDYVTLHGKGNFEDAGTGRLFGPSQVELI